MASPGLGSGEGRNSPWLFMIWPWPLHQISAWNVLTPQISSLTSGFILLITLGPRSVISSGNLTHRLIYNSLYFSIWHWKLGFLQQLATSLDVKVHENEGCVCSSCSHLHLWHLSQCLHNSWDSGNIFQRKSKEKKGKRNRFIFVKVECSVYLLKSNLLLN